MFIHGKDLTKRMHPFYLYFPYSLKEDYECMSPSILAPLIRLERRDKYWDSILDKVVPIGIDNYLEQIDRHWIQHIDDFTMRNKQYKEEVHGYYTINVGSFDIVEALGKPRIMDYDNELLQTIDHNTNFQDDDGYIVIEVNDGKTSTIDRTEVSTFTMEILPLADEKF